jgi:hypothetical protein
VFAHFVSLAVRAVVPGGWRVRGVGVDGHVGPGRFEAMLRAGNDARV